MQFPDETGVLPQTRRKTITNSIIEAVCLMENWSSQAATQYDKIKSSLLAYKVDLKSTTKAIGFIFLSSNEFVEDPANKYAREITLDMFGKLLQVFRVGDGKKAKCTSLISWIDQSFIRP